MRKDHAYIAGLIIGIALGWYAGYRRGKRAESEARAAMAQKRIRAINAPGYQQDVDAYFAASHLSKGSTDELA